MNKMLSPSKKKKKSKFKGLRNLEIYEYIVIYLFFFKNSKYR